MLIYTIATGNDDQWSVFVWLRMVLAVMLITAFAWIQVVHTNRGSATLINTHLFAHRSFLLALIAISLLMIMIDSYFFILTIFLQNGSHLSPLESGFVIIVQGAGFMMASIFAPSLFLKFRTWSLVFGLLLIIFSMELQATYYTADTSALTRYIFMFIHGAGVALVLPPLANIALSGLPDHLVGNASGVYATVQQIFGAIGVAICGNMFFAVLSGHADFESYYHAFQQAIAFNVLCLIGVLVVLLVNSRIEK